jgi:hypothetical protein
VLFPAVKNSPLLCIACIIWLSASYCTQKTDYSRDLSRVDSLSTLLAKSEKMLLQTDTLALHTTYNMLSASLHEISEKISKDTLDKKTAVLLSRAYVHAGHLRTLLENKSYLEKAIQESVQRLSDLKHDLAANLIEKNESVKYMSKEINATGKVCNAVNKTLENAASSGYTLDSLKTEISLLAGSLHSK